METEEDSGIFLFKNSKTKISTETIFVEEFKEEKETLSKYFDNSGKWMKRFLKRFLRPYLLHTPISAVTSEDIILESKKLPPFADTQGEEVLGLLKGKVRKVTRGNRRHKIKTRRQRNIKKNLK
jgi:hypothetical protein